MAVKIPAFGSWAYFLLRHLLYGMGQIFFPPVCCGCGQLISASGMICPQCWQKMEFICKPYCPIMGVPFRFYVGEGFLCGEALRDPPPFDHARAAVLHEGLAQAMVSGLKYNGKTELAPIMAERMLQASGDLLAECDYIVPLPLHRRRFWRRGYNQSAEIARRLAEKSHKVFAPQLLMRKKHTVPQVGLSAKKRAENMRGVFAVELRHRAQLKGRNVALVDDVYTTGATAKAAAKALKRAGAARVDVLTFSRVVKEVEF